MPPVVEADASYAGFSVVTMPSVARSETRDDPLDRLEERIARAEEAVTCVAGLNVPVPNGARSETRGDPLDDPLDRLEERTTRVEAALDRVVASLEALAGEAAARVAYPRVVTMPSVARPETLGDALDRLEERIARAGLRVVISSPNGYDENQDHKRTSPDSLQPPVSMTSGQILRAPMLIEFAISRAIDVGRASVSSVGQVVLPSNVRTALTAGNVVALYNPTNGCFLRIYGTSADFDGGARDLGELPFEWEAERFVVVAAGNNRVAFFNPSYRRFLRMEADGTLLADGSLALHIGDRPRVDEIFDVDCLASGDTPYLCNTYFHTDLSDDCQCEVAQIAGLEFA
jgi:phage shock protein A